VEPARSYSRFPFREAGSRIGVRVEEDVAMVEGGDQAHGARSEQPVPEHVAGHVADTHHAHGITGHVDTELPEVVGHRDPGALGGHAVALVVVAVPATGCEGVVEPEPGPRGDGVGGVGEGRGAAVGSDDEVGVIAVVADHPGWWHHPVAVEVIGDVEQAPDEGHVLAPRLRSGGGGILGFARQHEPALGTRGDDDRVLEHLCLDEVEDLVADVIAPIRPAQSTA